MENVFLVRELDITTNKMEQLIDNLVSEIEDLEARNEELRDRIEKLETFIENKSYE